MLLHNTEYSSLGYTVGPYFLICFIDNSVYLLSQVFNLSLLSSTPFANHKIVFYVYESVSVL